MQFRKDINGLRAIAVIAVVLFHFNANIMPGGFVGVDVFFVISGFLMSGIIFEGLNNNNFSLLKFYKSRAKRILPALSALCLFSVIYSFFFLYDNEFKDTISQSISATTFLSNFYFWKTSSYFSAGAETKLLLHTWSLSTEWQFYMIYPVILLTLSKIVNVKNIPWVIFLGFVLSFIISIYASPKWATTSYYLLPTRGWQMLLGGLAFFSTIELNKKYLNLLSSIGIILIITSCFIISKDNVWPGYLALIPSLGAFAILIGNSNFYVLKHKFLQSIGKYSYSIYLWHWVIIFMLYRYTNMNFEFIISGIFVSFILGFLSYELIEKKGLNKTNKTFIILSILLPITLFFLFETITKYRYISNTENNKLITYYQKENHDHNLSPWNYNLCNKNETCEQSDIFLWGDSHARALHYGLKNANLKNFTTLTGRSCPPSVIYPKYKHSVRVACNKQNKIALEQIKLKKPKTVILAKRYKVEDTDWNAISLKLKELGVKNVIVVGPVPQFKSSLPLLVAKKYMDKEFIKHIDMDKIIFSKNIKMNNTKNINYKYVDILSNICSSEGCLFKTTPKDNKKLTHFDAGHLSAEGSIYIVNKFILDKL